MSRASSGRIAFVATSVAAIWLATLAASIAAPPLITGSQHEHIPLVAGIGWLWAALATGFVVLAAGLVGHGSRLMWVGSAAAVVAVWIAVAIGSIAGPELVTGTDPTRVPLTAILSPFAGIVATAYIAIFAAAQGALVEEPMPAAAPATPAPTAPVSPTSAPRPAAS